MYCPQCNAEIKEGASYCGKCGTPLYQQNEQYQVFNYHEGFAKQNGAYVSFLGTYGLCMLIVLLLVLPAAIACPLLESVIGFGATFAIPISLSLLSVAAIVCLTIARAPYYQAAQQTIVFDKKLKKYYVIRFLNNQIYGWDNASRVAAAIYNANTRKEETKKAQSDQLCIQIITKYQNRQYQMSAIRKFLTDSDLNIIELNQPKAIKKSQKATTYAYINQKGKRKKVLIPNAYPNLKI